jgi:aerobic-type carbon monoxide dehydrogenase small subunit (CoxS/CutS family)
MSTETSHISFSVNGTKHEADVSVTTRLIDYLHDELGLTGTKFCCGIGVCRSCTVAARNRPGAPEVPMLSCSTPVVGIDGYEIRTVEGLGTEDNLSPLQQAFLDYFAFQCGYCTPGFLMAATLLVERLKHSPIHVRQLDAEIESACGSHVCRCTGYVRYYEAMKHVIRSTPGTLK